MKRRHFLNWIIILGGLWLSACSYQWREVDHNIDTNTLFDVNLKEAASGASGSAASVFLGLLGRANTNIFYAETNGEFGTPQSVVSVIDLSPFGLPYEYTPYDLKFARVVFLDGFDDSGVRDFALMVELQSVDGLASSKIFFRSAQPGQFSDHDFVVEMLGDNGAHILLRSFDVSDLYADELAGNIQLKVELVHTDGFQEEIGKFSTLAGFGN